MAHLSGKCSISARFSQQNTEVQPPLSSAGRVRLFIWWHPWGHHLGQLPPRIERISKGSCHAMPLSCLGTAITIHRSTYMQQLYYWLDFCLTATYIVTYFPECHAMFISNIQCTWMPPVPKCRCERSNCDKFMRSCVFQFNYWPPSLNVDVHIWSEIWWAGFALCGPGAEATPPFFIQAMLTPLWRFACICIMKLGHVYQDSSCKLGECNCFNLTHVD